MMELFDVEPGSFRPELSPFETEKALFVVSGGRRLRCGRTTGTCAALAAQGAACLLLTGSAPASASLLTPKGPKVEAPLENCHMEGGFRVTVSVPGGEEAAKKTFNPQLEIEGGISILGTSGIVEPMSAQALIDTVALEIRQRAAQGYHNIILTPGNYGMDFLRAQRMDRWGVPVVKCSNFIWDALDACGAEYLRGVLLVGHLGKLVKLAGGIMNTHSRIADCHTELFCAHAALRGADRELCRALMDCAASDACIAVLDGAGLREEVLDSLLSAIQEHLDRRTAGAFQAGAVVFSNQYGLLGRTRRAKELMEQWSTL